MTADRNPRANEQEIVEFHAWAERLATSEAWRDFVLSDDPLAIELRTNSLIADLYGDGA